MSRPTSRTTGRCGAGGWWTSSRTGRRGWWRRRPTTPAATGGPTGARPAAASTARRRRSPPAWPVPERQRHCRRVASWRPDEPDRSEARRSMLQSRSPQRPDDLLLEVEETSAGGVTDAVRRSRKAAAAWAAAPAMERSAGLVAAAEVLAAAAGEVTDLMVREVGKPVTEAAGGVGILRYYAQQVLDPDGETYPGPGPAALLLSRRRPRGVAGLITPWNFPVAIPLWKA